MRYNWLIAITWALSVMMICGFGGVSSIHAGDETETDTVVNYLQEIAIESGYTNRPSRSGILYSARDGLARRNAFNSGVGQRTVHDKGLNGNDRTETRIDKHIKESIFVMHDGIRNGTSELIRSGIKPGRFVNDRVFIIREDTPGRIISSPSITPGEIPSLTQAGQRVVSRQDMYSTVALYEEDGVECIGSGVRISTNVVITARHVIKGRSRVSVRSGDPVTPKRPRVVAKVVGLSSEVSACPTFTPDIGAVIISNGSECDAPIASINWASELPTGFSVSVGYGLTKDELLNRKIQSKQSRRIGWAAVTISGVGVDRFGLCPSAEFLVGEFLPGEVNSSSCDGDSGGGNYMIDQYGRLHLIGITSRGIRDRNGMSCGYGSVYTRVAAFKSEIDTLIDKYR